MVFQINIAIWRQGDGKYNAIQLNTHTKREIEIEGKERYQKSERDIDN